ncbi:MAG TPA: glycine zipper 2TM domain-containing protein [Azospira sp.]|nr:glycine zipper 2TM domain-containing protein [Azospira sp.]
MIRKQSVLIPALVAALLAATLGGCANSQSGSSYSRGQTRQELSVRQGVVESVRKVTIEGGNTPVGGVSGAVIGGMAGSNVGGGRGSTVGAILGAVAGGVAGSALEERVSKKDGVEITVKLDNGNLVAIVQEADEEFHPGERVRILSGNGNSRVSH